MKIVIGRLFSYRHMFHSQVFVLIVSRPPSVEERVVGKMGFINVAAVVVAIAEGFQLLVVHCKCDTKNAL